MMRSCTLLTSFNYFIINALLLTHFFVSGLAMCLRLEVMLLPDMEALYQASPKQIEKEGFTTCLIAAACV